MLKKILLLLVLLIGGFLAYVAARPDEFKAARSTTIPAPPAAVFPYLNDLRKWQDWSPWAKLDPNATYSFSGPETGEKSSFSWVGNNEIGVGSMTIVESKPDELVAYRLEFKKPMEGTSNARFDLKAEDGKTVVTWSMSGKHNFIEKAFCVIMNGEKMIAGQFDQGLANLSQVVQTSTEAPAPAPVAPAP